MIDIFADIKPQPNLYIADVTVIAHYKAIANSKKVEVITLHLEKTPIVLHEGKFPTDNYRKRFLRRVFDEHIKKGKFETTQIRVAKIENITFSSKLAYKFDYDKH